MSESPTGVILDVAAPRAGGRSVRTLIGSIGDLGYLVKHLSTDTGQGAWRLFANERNLANHLRAMALAEGEPAPKARRSSRPPGGVSRKIGAR